MDLRQLECFLAVAEHLHFAKAGESLYLAQPTVSESVRRLERELGGDLFDRTTRRVTLTPLGEAFLPEARTAFESIRHAYDRGRALASSQSNELLVGYAGDAKGQLVDVVNRVQRRYAGGIVSLHAMPTPRQVRLVIRGDLHAAIAWEPIVEEGLKQVHIGSSGMVVVVPSDHPFTNYTEVELSELAREPLVAWTRAVNPGLYDVFSDAMDAAGAAWTLVGTADGAANVATRVLAGFGIGVMVEAFLPRHPVDGVSYVRIANSSTLVRRVLLWRARERHQMLPILSEELQACFGETKEITDRG